MPGQVRQGLRVAFALLLLLWPATIVGAAAAASETTPSAPRIRLAALVYLAGGVICHQQPERSFRLRGVALPVCARCFGLYAAAPLGLLAGLIAGGRRPRGRALLLWAAAPTAATLVVEWSGVPMSSAGRALAAAPLGAVVAWIVLGAAARRERRGDAGGVPA